MNGLVQALLAVVERCRRLHTDGAGQHRRFIRQNVAKHVAGNHHVKLARILHQLHRRIVDVHARERYVGVFGRDLGSDLFPQLHGFEHVGLIDGTQFFAAFTRGGKTDMHDAADFAFGIAHGVEAFALAFERAIFGNADATRLTKINVTGQFTQNQNVQTGHHFGLER